MRRSEANPEAHFRQLFEETRRDLLAYALRRTRAPEDAADVIAETYLIAWRKFESLPSGGEARLWLYGVARNVIRRGASREHGLEAVVDRLAAELRAVRTAENTADDEQTASLRSAVMTLPKSQREVLLLTAWEGLTPKEISVVTAVPVNLVRVRLHRARSRLKRELRPAVEPLTDSRASPIARLPSRTT